MCMVLAVIDGWSVLFTSWDEYREAVFSPDTQIGGVVELRVSGGTYAARKESARAAAQDIQRYDVGGLYWQDYAVIWRWLTRAGKRYGLTTEFRENGLL